MNLYRSVASLALKIMSLSEKKWMMALIYLIYDKHPCFLQEKNLFRRVPLSFSRGYNQRLAPKASPWLLI